jgi:microcompartment protein CcmK/EutM
MILAEVTGTVVASARADRMDSSVYKVVVPCTPDGKPAGTPIIALDITGAGAGEIVLVSQGSSVRQTEHTIDKPVDALIVGIADSVSEDGREVYRK